MNLQLKAQEADRPRTIQMSSKVFFRRDHRSNGHRTEPRVGFPCFPVALETDRTLATVKGCDHGPRHQRIEIDETCSGLFFFSLLNPPFPTVMHPHLMFTSSKFCLLMGYLSAPLSFFSLLYLKPRMEHKGLLFLWRIWHMWYWKLSILGRADVMGTGLVLHSLKLPIAFFCRFLVWVFCLSRCGDVRRRPRIQQDGMK